MRDSVNEMRKEEGQPPLSEDEWPSATTEFTTTFFADHAIRKITEGFNLITGFSLSITGR